MKNSEEILPKEQNRSEEVQAIIDRMPTRGAIWVAILVGVLIGVVFILGFIIKYPDTVDGQITITALLRCVWLPIVQVRCIC